MKAFITGSRAYGKPAPKSDVDLVLFCTDETRAVLKANADKPRPGEDESVIRYGKLNVIACTDERQWAAWFVGTQSLRLSGSPVDRDEAKKFLDSVRDLMELRDNY